MELPAVRFSSLQTLLLTNLTFNGFKFLQDFRLIGAPQISFTDADHRCDGNDGRAAVNSRQHPL